MFVKDLILRKEKSVLTHNEMLKINKIKVEANDTL